MSVARAVLRKVYKSHANNGLLHVFMAAATTPLRLVRARRNQPLTGPGAPQTFDDQLGVDTSSTSEWRDITAIDSPNWVHGAKNQPVSETDFNEALGKLEIRHGDFVFIDFGSGKGRAVLLASRYAFKRVLGIEYCSRLHAVAERNIAVCHDPARKSPDVRSVLGDAASFPLPTENLVLYFNNPFDDVIMRKVLDNVEESLSRSPRPVFVIYIHPLAINAFLERKRVFAELARGSDYVLFKAAQGDSRS
jgi:SAM-dependent methyltransferase